MKRNLLLILLFTTAVISSKAITVGSSLGYFQASYTSDCTPSTVTFTALVTPPGAVSKKIDFDYTGMVNWIGPTINHTYTVANTYDVWVYYFDGVGSLVSQDYIRLEIHGQPGPVFADYGITQACPGDKIRFRVSQGWESQSSYTYSWNWGDGSPIETSNYSDLKHTYAAPGNYTITVTTNGTCGGPYVSTGNFTVGTNIPLPSSLQYSVYLSEDLICPNHEIYFGYPEDYAYTYVQWGDGSSSSNNEHLHEYLNPGVYYPRVSIVNGCGYSYVYQDTVTVANNLPWNPNLFYDVYNSSPVCPGEDVHFQTWMDAVAYAWRDQSGNTISNSNYFEIPVTASSIYSVTLTNGCGFDTTINTQVTVSNYIPIDPSDFNPFMPDSVCTGSSFPFSGDFMSDNAGNISFSWDFGDGNLSGLFNGFHVYTADGNYTVTVMAENSCGMDTTTVLSVYAGPNVAPDPGTFMYFVPEDAEVCPGDEALFVGLFYLPDATFTADFGDGNISSTPSVLNIFGINYFYFLHSYSATGTYNTSITMTNGCGLSVTQTLDVRVGTNMPIDFGAFYDEAANICFGEPINFYGWGASQYIWDFGDGSGTLVTNTVMEPVPHIYEEPGAYNVTVQATNGCGNTGYDEMNIIIPDNKINITTNTVDSDCGQSNGKVIAVITGGNPPFDVNWSNGSTEILVDSLSAGIYICNVIDQNGCYNFGIATLSDAQAPAIVVNTVVDVTCNGGNDGAIDINVIGNTGPFTYSWSNGSVSQDLSGLVAGPYEVYVTDANGCITTASISVNEPDPVNVSFLVNNATCGSSNGVILATANGNSGPFTYVWSGSGFVGPQRNNLPYGIYEVNVIDAEGCVVTASTTVNEDNGMGGPAIAVNSVSDLDCNGAGSSIDINVFAASGTPSYLWSNGSTTQDITVTSEGTYTVTVTDALGCHAIEIFTIDHAAPAGQNICMVTVDSMYSVNNVVWEKPVTADISHYKIYRESSQNGLYYHVGTIDYDSLSVFTDYVANPMITAWRYKISAVDYCGVESVLSEAHKTIHLNQNIGLGGTINLIWDNYYGFAYPTYNIIRYTASSGWQVIANVSSANTSYTDPTPPADPTLFYVIEVVPASPCLATRAANNNSTRSNRSQNPVGPPAATGVAEIGNIEGIAIYPNPNNGLFTLEADFAAAENAIVLITSVEGKQIKAFTVNGSPGRYRSTIDLSAASPGIYFLRIQSETSSFAKKIIIGK